MTAEDSSFAGTYEATGQTVVTGGTVSFTGDVTLGKLLQVTGGTASFDSTNTPITVTDLELGPLGTLETQVDFDVTGKFTWTGGTVRSDDVPLRFRWASSR